MVKSHQRTQLERCLRLKWYISRLCYLIITNREVHYKIKDSKNVNISRYNAVKYGKRSLIYVKDAISLRTFKSAVTKWLQELDDISNINFL